jgi:hypothetical protein
MHFSKQPNLKNMILLLHVSVHQQRHPQQAQYNPDKIVRMPRVISSGFRWAA